MANDANRKRRPNRRRARSQVAMKPELRAPTQIEEKQIAAAADRSTRLAPRVKVQHENGAVIPPHSDRVGSLIQLMDALGSRSPDFISVVLGKLNGAARERGEPPGATSLNAALAIVQAIDPENELETALAVQMASTHSLSLDLLVMAKQTDHIEKLQLYGNLAVKMQRTFTAQIEALARLRGKGQQTVRVEHVNVQPGGQAIVGDVHQHLPGGTGVHSEIERQPYGAIESTRGKALPSPDPARDGVPLPRDAERPLSAARRKVARRSRG